MANFSSKANSYKPSLVSGYARSQAEALYPKLWTDIRGLWYPNLGVTGNTVKDYSNRKHHGSFVNTTPADAWVKSRYGPVLDFGGPAAADEVQFALMQDILKTGTPYPGNFSIFILLRSEVVTTRAGVLSAGDNNGINGIMLYFEGDTVLHFSLGTWSSNTASITVAQEKWYSVVCRRKLTTLDVYANGVRGTSAAYSNPLNLDYTFLFGRGFQASFNRFFEGQIACAGIWKKALSQDEIALLNNDPYAPLRYKNTPVMWTDAVPPTPSDTDIFLPLLGVG